MLKSSLTRVALGAYLVLASRVPLYVIMRAGESISIADLGDPLALNVLVKPGDVVNVSARPLQYYFIGGRINSPGQKLCQPGLTLTQAILATGGLSRSQESVEISREEANGLLTTTK